MSDRFKSIPLPRYGRSLAALVARRAPRFELWAVEPGMMVVDFSLARFGFLWAARRLLPTPQNVVWLPAFFCHEAVVPLLEAGIRVRYYPIAARCTPDWAWLQRQPSSPGDMFVLVHFFGFEGETAVAATVCAARGWSLVEDAAHVLRPFGSVGRHGVVAVYSVRKFFALPDGGVVVGSPAVAARAEEGLPRASTRSALVGLGVRLLQRVAGARLKRRHRDAPGPAPSSPVARMSTVAWALLAYDADTMDHIARARRANYARLAERLADAGLCFPALPDAKTVPFFFRAVQPQMPESRFLALRAAGVPAGRWPDLPPEILADRTELGATARREWSESFTLPVHQDLNTGQVDWMAAQVHAVFAGGAAVGN